MFFNISQILISPSHIFTTPAHFFSLKSNLHFIVPLISSNIFTTPAHFFPQNQIFIFIAPLILGYPHLSHLFLSSLPPHLSLPKHSHHLLNMFYPKLIFLIYLTPPPPPPFSASHAACPLTTTSTAASRCRFKHQEQERFWMVQK